MDPHDLQGTNDTASPAERMFMKLLAGLQKLRNPVDTLTPVLPDVAFMRLLIVNVAFVGPAGAGSGGWTLVDAGLPGSAGSMVEAAERRFGRDSAPSGIVLTHGHFDHVGAVVDLLKRWDVPVYAHEAELPYLTGRADYMKPDPNVDPGMMAKASPLYPEKAIDLGDRVRALPGDGSVPSMPGWRWVHTPGHTPGHVVLFREEDGTVIVGDAFTSVEQESATDVMRQKKEIHGPPKYLTPDWRLACESVRRIQALEPQLAVLSHGEPLRGEELREALEVLVRDMERTSVPEEGR